MMLFTTESTENTEQVKMNFSVFSVLSVVKRNSRRHGRRGDFAGGLGELEGDREDAALGFCGDHPAQHLGDVAAEGQAQAAVVARGSRPVAAPEPLEDMGRIVRR